MSEGCGFGMWRQPLLNPVLVSDVGIARVFDTPHGEAVAEDFVHHAAALENRGDESLASSRRRAMLTRDLAGRVAGALVAWQRLPAEGALLAHRTWPGSSLQRRRLATRAQMMDVFQF